MTFQIAVEEVLEAAAVAISSTRSTDVTGRSIRRAPSYAQPDRCRPLRK